MGGEDKEKHQETHSGFSGFRGLSRHARSLIARVGFQVAFPGFPSATKFLHDRLRAFPVFPDASTTPTPSTAGRIKACPQVS